MSITDETCWQAEVERRQRSGNDLEFSPAQFAAASACQADDSALISYLDALVNEGQATAIDALLCPMPDCRQHLPQGSSGTACPHCHADFQSLDVTPLAERRYRLLSEGSRDIRWLIVIHGMKSRAKWQEEFSWEIANRLSYSAPVLIYKYGWVTVDVLVRWLHQRQARRLGERIRIAIRQAAQSRHPDRPDIIAHSFGTHLFALILQDPRFDDLRFGRVITAGSIVRPDFDWNRYLAQGRVEAVLNHVGEQDAAAPFAQYAIPGTGPGGRFGYMASDVLNVRTPGYGHSGFFVAEHLRELIARDGLWHGFLTRPLRHFHPPGNFQPSSDWKPAWVGLRLMSRTLGYLLFCLLAPFSWLLRRLDP